MEVALVVLPGVLTVVRRPAVWELPSRGSHVIQRPGHLLADPPPLRQNQLLGLTLRRDPCCKIILKWYWCPRGALDCRGKGVFTEVAHRYRVNACLLGTEAVPWRRTATCPE